jgi:hypothetical protein
VFWVYEGGQGDRSPLGNFLECSDRASGSCFQKAYDWALWIIPKVEKFPKSFKFSIGQSMVTKSIELPMNLVDRDLSGVDAGSLGAALREVNRLR